MFGGDVGRFLAATKQATKRRLPIRNISMITIYYGQAGGSRQSNLLCRELDPLERVACDRHPARRRYGSGEDGRLIEASRPAPAPVQRHRNQGIGIGEKLPSGAAEPGARSRRSPYLRA